MNHQYHYIMNYDQVIKINLLVILIQDINIIIIIQIIIIMIMILLLSNKDNNINKNINRNSRWEDRLDIILINRNQNQYIINNLRNPLIIRIITIIMIKILILMLVR